MKLKDIRNFSKEINKKRTIQAGIVFVGTMLVVASSSKIDKKELANTTNQVVEYMEPTYGYHTFNRHPELRPYEFSKEDYKEFSFIFDREIENSVNRAVTMAVIRGKYGNGEERKQRLEELGFDYEQIQSLVNSWYDCQEMSR